MKDSMYLYSLAERRGIPVIAFSLPVTASMCVQDGDKCYIGIDEHLLKREKDRKTHLAHELGHCETGSFYNRYAAMDIREKHENRADKWAIKRLIPEQELDRAVAEGYTNIWALAEYFQVSEEFMKKAVCWYTYGNMAAELYF